MLLSGLLKPLEKLLNHYLSNDAEKAAQLAKLSGKVIQINLNPLHFTCYIHIDNDQLRLSKQTDTPANTIISGTPFSLMQTLNQKGMTLSEEVSITGDLLLIQTLKNIFLSIDMDWEESLSQYMGDVAAHTACQWFRKITQYQQYAVKSFVRNSKEYWQEELKYFPPRAELEDFFNDVDVIRNDVERLQARIDFLT